MERTNTPQGLQVFMSQATSAKDWDARIKIVKAENGGDYPSFWFTTIVMSGVLKNTAAKWGDNGEIEIIIIDKKDKQS